MSITERLDIYQLFIIFYNARTMRNNNNKTKQTKKKANRIQFQSSKINNAVGNRAVQLLAKRYCGCSKFILVLRKTGLVHRRKAHRGWVQIKYSWLWKSPSWKGFFRCRVCENIREKYTSTLFLLPRQPLHGYC